MSDEKVTLDTKWVITLNSGDVMSVFADESRIVGEDRVFEVTVGESRKQVVVARVPASLIRDVDFETVGDDPEEARP
jgi:uncharacterized protein (DUF342 family)